MKKYICLIIMLFSVTALFVKAFPPPERKGLTLQELMANIYSFEGKVIEVEITRAANPDQQRDGTYRAFCHYHHNDSCTAEPVIFPVEAYDFIEELVDKQYAASSTDLYVLVKDGRLEAVGEKYKKSKGTYSW